MFNHVSAICPACSGNPPHRVSWLERTGLLRSDAPPATLLSDRWSLSTTEIASAKRNGSEIYIRLCFSGNGDHLVDDEEKLLSHTGEGPVARTPGREI